MVDIKIGKFWLMFNVKFWVKKYEKVRGLSSTCDDLMHVLFLDYDNISLEFVKKELMLLQFDYELTPFYLFTTKDKDGVGNYHAICLTKFTPASATIHTSELV